MWELSLSFTVGRRAPSLSRRSDKHWEKRDMPSDDLDAFLNEIAGKADADFHTRENAAKRAEQERVDFLQGFRDLSDRAIRPEFERAQRSTDAVVIKADHSRDSVELSVTMKKSSSESVSGYLRYKAELDSRRIMREGHVDRLPQRRESFPVHPDNLTPEEVVREIRSLVHDVQFALENKRA
jgi:hypothetical protein